ncbi:hypothetical protein Dimus_037555, partial [Dionaea muscipula]
GFGVGVLWRGVVAGGGVRCGWTEWGGGLGGWALRRRSLVDVRRGEAARLLLQPHGGGLEAIVGSCWCFGGYRGSLVVPRWLMVASWWWSGGHMFEI